MDVGGGNYGAHMIGQFHELLNAENALVLYVVNPYRPWSDSAEAVEETMRRVLGSARLERISVLANPNYGPHTTLEEIVSGVGRVRALVGERPVDFVCALEKQPGRARGGTRRHSGTCQVRCAGGPCKRHPSRTAPASNPTAGASATASPPVPSRSP